MFCEKIGEVRIISPATIVAPEYIDGAARVLADAGFAVSVAPHAKGPACGSYAASDDDRLADILDAFADPNVSVIFCARGGYGCNHLLERIPLELVRQNPKWLVGFSDVSALHALMLRAGVVSLHAPMAKHLATLGADHYCSREELAILRGEKMPDYRVDAHPLNHPGRAEGRLIGGNLAVLEGLAETPFDILRDIDTVPSILFIEDIAEPIYKVERILYRLRMAGKLSRLKGLIVGHFTEYKPDRNYAEMERMISAVAADAVPGPVCFGFPAGHTDDNLPLALGAHATLEAGADGVSLIQSL